MKRLVAVLFVGLLVSPAGAGLDPDVDSMGIYFDTAGNANCLAGAAFMPVTAYLLLMNPAGPTDAFECSVTMSGAPYFILSTSLPDGGTNWCQSPDCYAHHSESPYPVYNGAIELANWVVMLTATSPFLFHIGPASMPSLPGGLPVVSGNGILRQCGVASGDVNLPVAAINLSQFCPVDNDARTFGEVKSLFR